MRRVVVVGNAGSGKTVLSLEIGRRLGRPVVHLDRHFWNPGWLPTPPPEWRRRHGAIVGRDEWIIDGNYEGTLGERLLRADTAVFLDRPGALCLLAVFRRSLGNLGRTRPDLSPGCPEQIPDRDFIDFIWRYTRVYRPRVMRHLIGFARRGGVVHHLRSRRQVRRFLDSLDAPDAAGTPAEEAVGGMC